MYTARRPHADNMMLMQTEEQKSKDEKTLDLKNKELPPYDSVIPVNPLKYISYGQQIIGLRDIKAFPTRLESTT